MADTSLATDTRSGQARQPSTIEYRGASPMTTYSAYRQPDMSPVISELDSTPIRSELDAMPAYRAGASELEGSLV